MSREFEDYLHRRIQSQFERIEHEQREYDADIAIEEEDGFDKSDELQEELIIESPAAAAERARPSV